MNPFDTEIIGFFNQLSQVSWTIDSTIKFISKSNLIKGGAVLIIFWWGWFRVNINQPYVQVHLVSTLIGCFIAMVLARILALLLPFRLRPIHEEGLDFTLPYSMEITVLEGWSSFPSDHAVLFYALATGMFYISKKVGIFSLVYITLFVGLPRIYLGLHYPTDIIGGAIIGLIVVLLCNSNYFIEKISRPTYNYSNTKPEIFYPIFFIITFQIADMFNSSRAIIGLLKRLWLSLISLA